MSEANKFDVIIIGAGVGGLTAALQLAHTGKKVLVLEKQTIPGGFATTFKRRGFIFESAVHCVDAMAEGEDIRNFLDETAVSPKVEYIKLNNFSRIIYPNHDFVADFDKEKFKIFLKKSFPSEDVNIERLFKEFDKFFSDFDAFCNAGIADWLKILLIPFFYRRLMVVSGCTFEQYFSRFTKNKELIGIIGDIWRFVGLPPSKVSAFYFLNVLRGYYFSKTDYVKGGFGHLFQAISERIRELGSEIRFNSCVAKIITENTVVKKVLTQSGEEFYAEAVISNANAIDSLTNLLDDVQVKEKYSKLLLNQEKSISAFQVYLGLKVPARLLGMQQYMYSINSSYDHDKNYKISFELGYKDAPIALVDHAQIDSSLVPAGKGSLMIMVLDSFRHWKDLSEENYKKIKAEVADILIKRASKYLPGLLENIDFIEIATPMTMARYGTSPEGAIYGFAQTVKQSGFNRLDNKTKIKGLFLAGAWTFPGGGVHGCFVSGLQAADLALKYLKKN